MVIDHSFEKVADGIKPDAKKRVLLHGIPIQEGVSYHIYVNSAGQIMLDPQVTIPASELWVFENKDILSALDQGMAESAAGKLKDRGSFSRHVKNAA